MKKRSKEEEEEGEEEEEEEMKKRSKEEEDEEEEEKEGGGWSKSVRLTRRGSSLSFISCQGRRKMNKNKKDEKAEQMVIEG